MKPDRIQLDFWNVGQGDASTITWPNGELTVIDCGPKGNSLGDFISDKHPCINNIFITHNDEDHLGGLVQILEVNGDKVGCLWMLSDRSKLYVKRIFSKITRIFDSNKITRLEHKGQQTGPLFRFGDYSVEICFPGFVANIEANSSNATSAILCLKYNGNPVVVWGADNSLATIAAKSPSPVPLLFGPHHGSPKERKNVKSIDKHLGLLRPSQCFLSFATVNGYDHPGQNYIASLRKIDCSITCSQLAKKCAGGRTLPVFDGDGRYGHLSPSKNVDNVICHGHTRLYVQGTTIIDEYENEYREAVKSLPNALCNRSSQ